MNLKKTFIVAAIVMSYVIEVSSAQAMDLWFPPNWQANTEAAKEIATALTKNSGLSINARIASSYPQIFDEFKSDKETMVYVGSFAQALIRAQKLGEGLVQAQNGKEFYSGVLIYKSGEDPSKILMEFPENIAYAVGASSGESSALAATSGKAKFKTKSHTATAGAVKSGRAKAGVVKNWWWQGNKDRFPELSMYEIPGISLAKNPDNVLAVSSEVSMETRKKIIAAAKASKAAFSAKDIVDFSPNSLDFSLQLMSKGKIDTNNYVW